MLREARERETDRRTERTEDETVPKARKPTQLRGQDCRGYLLMMSPRRSQNTFIPKGINLIPAKMDGSEPQVV